MTKLKLHTKALPHPVTPIDGLEELVLTSLLRGDEGLIAAVDLILTQAVAHRAGDVHFEPWHNGVSVRFRIDGVLHDVAHLPLDKHDRIVARLKVLSRLIAYKKDIPQEGRIEPETVSCNKPMRVSTFPTVNGEKVVVRVLDAAQHLLNLEELGFDETPLSALREFIGRPHGVLLLTGPCSSGKTTTIYALLRELLDTRQPRPHVVTIEDPVEYRLPYLAQSQVQPAAGFTFEAALRSALRQDPDVLMIGEIRDAETARAAIQAGLTGHLVISTIHSGTAAGVFARLLDMGVEPFLLASAVSLVLAQRLVRRLCPACRHKTEPSESLLSAYGLDRQDGPFWEAPGCDACEQLGFRGRTALSEMLSMNEELADLILGRVRTSVIEQHAVLHAHTTLRQDGIARAQQGVTTLEEVHRAVSLTGEVE